MFRLLALAAAATLAVLLFSPAAGATLRGRLSDALASSGVPWSKTGALVTNLSTGHVLYARGRSRPLRPASNEKLTVTLGVLDRLGPSARIPTRVIGLGGRDGNLWRGSMFLKGYGDPTLKVRDLRRLAARIRARGIRRLTGHVLGDESYFDARRTAPGWKPSFYKLECPPLTALIVARGKRGDRTSSNPAKLATRRFRTALRRAGVAVPKTVRLGVAPAHGRVLARTSSPKVATIVRRMNHRSDNFFAEMLLKRLGKVQRGRGTTDAGLTSVRRVLRQRGIPRRGIRLVDGSGLSLYDRLTARTIGRLLRNAYRDDSIRPAFFDSLPRAGVEGTLEDRMRREPARGYVRAKTGTTDNASALSGYVGRKYVFSVLQNGNPVPYTSSRASQDRFAQILAARAPLTGRTSRVTTR